MSFEQMKQQIIMLKQVVRMMQPEQRKEFCNFVIGVMVEVMKE